ncbi:hypothetical protein FMUND_15660 [Fusarium mundagurra]|uniref:Acetoacetate decarboxylase n=1 Tax=Fusarium mundagurra TaxID=1567541 RepID=A0A8H6CY41_9HYPO|nr:hypothetical protein FMUND_15660 [Fusarium mundagurra]
MSIRSQPFIGGLLHMSQALPGQAYKFDGPTFPAQICYAFRFTSTYEAIEKLILPPPLKVDRSEPPEVICWYFSSSNSVGPGGTLIPYQGFQFRGHTEHKGVKALAGWEYVDGLAGNKAAMDVMGSWAVQFGMMKRLADFSFIPIDGDKFEVTIKRNGTTLIRLVLTQGSEIDQSIVAGMADNPANPFSKPTLTVREIPNEDYSAYLDQSVLLSPTKQAVIVRRAWEVPEISVEFGHLDDDPLSGLEPKDAGTGVIVNIEVTKGVFNEMKVLDKIH